MAWSEGVVRAITQSIRIRIRQRDLMQKWVGESVLRDVRWQPEIKGRYCALAQRTRSKGCLLLCLPLLSMRVSTDDGDSVKLPFIGPPIYIYLYCSFDGTILKRREEEFRLQQRPPAARFYRATVTIHLQFQTTSYIDLLTVVVYANINYILHIYISVIYNN